MNLLQFPADVVWKMRYRHYRTTRNTFLQHCAVSDRCRFDFVFEYKVHRRNIQNIFLRVKVQRGDLCPCQRLISLNDTHTQWRSNAFMTLTQ